MSDYHDFTQKFLRGLRGVPGYVDSLCDCCKGSCGEQPDDQCLISAWCSYIQGAYDNQHDPEEAGRRCAQSQVPRRQMDEAVRLPCEGEPAS